ncbi:MAG: DNA topoisomerase 4 subunit A [Bacteroidetes bacterium]|nr:DNA topoisomerase 4 subunit A [Bacteroidota bacterium]
MSDQTNGHIEEAALHDITNSRYLNYALSVITSRALPDIRDGLKPVQRRILYSMFASLRLYPDARYRKSATIVGDTMGKYHPHGDNAIYDAMARMAQSFSLRDPLVDGHGNFGSIDGDKPAAMRYTEAKLLPLAMSLLEELRQNTVAFRPNFDATLSEPVVLPAQIPNLLVNGATGIAVGMATSIPPHNLGEVLSSAISMVDSLLRKSNHTWPSNAIHRLLDRYIQGPDFPTGGKMINSREELHQIYNNGEGTIIVQGTYKVERKSKVIITSIPYAINKGDLVEKIANHIAGGKVPQLIDIRDESTDDTRIVLDLKRGANIEAAMGYLFKYTPLQSRFHVNLTCLLPTSKPDICEPKRINLQEALEHFLEFRLEVVTRRLRHELDQLEERIHILDGFEMIFDALDDAIKIIRSSRNRADSAQRLRHRFLLSEPQVNAILDTRLYKLSQIEIDSVREELEVKRIRAKEIRKLLNDELARWKVVRQELKDIKQQFSTPRRTLIGSEDDRSYEFSEEDFIVDEDTVVIITRAGWIKRQGSYSELQSIRVREGDEVGWVLGAGTRSTLVLWTNYGRAYTIRVNDIVATTGHGIPMQKLFDFSDKERVIGAIPCDPRIVRSAENIENKEDLGFVIGVTAKSLTHQQPLKMFSEVSTRKGRAFMRLSKNDVILGIWPVAGDDFVCMASRKGYVIIFSTMDVPVRAGPSKGVIGMRLDDDDQLVAAIVSANVRDGVTVLTSRGRTETIRRTKYESVRRGGKGKKIIQRGELSSTALEPIVMRLT